MIGPEQAREPNYTDDDITFFMGLYNDRACAVGALARLREHYPTARVIVRSDGDADPKNGELAQQFDVDFRAEQRLFPIKNGGALMARTLELFLEQPTPYLFKIDPDSAVYRRFRFLPEQPGLFGSLQHSKEGCPSIQGGCIGIPEASARAILDSGLLVDPRLKDPASHHCDSDYFIRMGLRAQRKGFSSFDWILGWASTELGLPLTQFEEVHCKAFARNNVENADLRFALTHPVYFD